MSKAKRTKLSEKQKADAMKMLSSGVGPTELSKKFGKTPAYFSQLKKGASKPRMIKIGRKASKAVVQSSGAPISQIVNDAIDEAVQKLEGLRNLFK